MGNELYHFGIKGQKWGVRRFQNKDGSLTPAGKKRYGTVGPNVKVKSKTIKEERQNLRRMYREQDPEYSESAKLRKQASDLYKKYDFDGDDGGGGRTAADRKAGEKYMELWEKISSIEDGIDNRARKKATEAIIEKYGEKRISDMQKIDNAKSIAIITAVLATPIALMKVSG